MDQGKSNTIADIYIILPGRNCGDKSPCGYPRCAFFAKALLEGKADISECPYLDDEKRQDIILVIDKFFR